MARASVVAVVLVLLLLVSHGTADLCKFTDPSSQKAYDLSPLKRTSLAGDRDANWKAVEETSDSTSRDSYTYFMNICGDILNPGSFGPTIPTSEVGVVQVTEDGDVYVAGNTTNSVVTSQHAADLRYVFTPVKTAGYSRGAVIAFSCGNVGLGKPTFFEEVSTTNQGRYIFFWETCAACSVDTDIWRACPDKLPPSRAQCSSYTKEMGKAILIAFISLMLGAFLLGVAYKRLVQGAKGLEQIPYIDVLRTVCCAGGSSGVAYDDVGGGSARDETLVSTQNSWGSRSAVAPASGRSTLGKHMLADLSDDEDDPTMVDA